MLITFTSKSSADVLMYETHAKPILDLLGKDTQRGVITGKLQLVSALMPPLHPMHKP